MLGGPEVVIIIAIGLLLFGPKKLPELARAVGRAVGEYQKAVKEFEHEADSVRKDVLDEGSSAAPGPRGAPGVKRRKGPTPQLTKIAKNLGIDTANKSESQLLAEINRKTKQTEEEIAKKKTEGAESIESKPKPKKAEPKTAPH
ncbi:MAG: twin-arginine translocase TatA/TatE family subunit [Candidatus Hydrothermarchaeales archaeon]